MSELFSFASNAGADEVVKDMWKVLVIDDEESIHVISNTVMKNMIIEGKQLDIYNAYSAAEAKEILKEHQDIAMAFVDVVMETPTAGLDLVNYIRSELKNEMIRLVIRTGQPNDAPAKEVIDNYDISDYKEKTELTLDKLYITVRASLRQYQDIKSLNDRYQDFYCKMMTDNLTGLPNRSKLNEALDRSGKMSLILINIRNFSKVNSEHGFTFGDTILMEVAKVLKNDFTHDMKLFHLEADHFVLLGQEKVEKDEIKSIQIAIEEHISKSMQIELKIAVQIGAVLQEDGNLIQKAEYALHQVKLEDNDLKVYKN